MSVWTLALLIAAVAVFGVLGGAATRYERYGPEHQRGPAGALAVVSLTFAITVALVTFAVATLQAEGLAWRLLGVACAAGVFGGLVAARGVDHYLVLRSTRGAVRALRGDVRRGGHGVRAVAALVPWAPVAAALSGTAQPRRRQRDPSH
ncbi:hypothetical protein BH18ACT7_BH18ACT7_06060 [soil metagenome]